MFLLKYICMYFLIILNPQLINVKCSLQEEEISRWVNELGYELWNLGKTITKFSEIQGTYGFLNAQVERKNPKELLSEIVQNITQMMDRKMDAISCIMDKAEKEAEAFVYNNSDYQYYSSKYSPISSQNETEDMYLPMKLNNDTHFYNLPVGTDYSSVHVPTNIFDRHREAAFSIQWSKALDEVFLQNYNSDPALSWQYFGSTSGIMRHYPAKRWEDNTRDLFDCRIRTWFIEAATCTKDVVLLVDNSGSMDGMGKHIAALTLYSILDTFSNNDYINVLNYSATTNYTIPCFEGMLVQATKENTRVFKEAVRELKPEGKTNLTQALEKAFELLRITREEKGCNEMNNDCNQAIMIITDGISKNLSKVIMDYNYLADGKYIPVRIFTYLIGQEVTNVNEIMWMACASRGYYTHVQSLEQVTASVLKYINVIARPLVLQEKEHPVSWTHAYNDLTYDDKNDNQINEPYRLLTSVAVPAFDTKVNKNNETRVADLLGVAATDVPIDDIKKLTFPYKIGVNGYVFIVSNNGYVLMHPDLRPVFEGKLTENYNSIDLTEVEQIDDNLPPREINDTLYELRLALVNGENGSMHNIPIKYHYDNMRRVTRELYDYYYAPLKNTPFSIAIALPNRYGNYSLDVGDEISKNRHTGTKITDFFLGSNWKIHPKWVYCKYHYLEGHEFKTPEEELLHFLGKMYDLDFQWENQYESELEEEIDEVKCGRKTHGDDDYYCDRQLVQRLVFDAKNTLHAFQGPWVYQSGELPIFRRFNATLRFVATMSGLTRWEYLYEEIENSTKKEFGDLHSKATDETWYKSAVIQRKYDIESFVYSVPFDSGNMDDLLVTGSYAIFPSDAGYEAPGSVVGFQFSHSHLKARVEELSSKVSNQCPQCGNCNTTLNCYIVDSSGYIIMSQDTMEIGKFFGEFHGDIMDSMIDEGIFEKVTVYDFQALCLRGDNSNSSSTHPLTPFNYINWFFTKLTLFALEFNIYHWFCSLYVYAQEIINNTNIEESVNNATISVKDNEKNQTESETIEDEVIVETEDEGEEEEEEDEEVTDDYYEKYQACDLKRELFILQQQLFLHDNYPVEVVGKISRPYYIKKVPYSNLIFLAINSTMPQTNKVYYKTTPKQITYGQDVVYPCQKINLNYLPRRRLSGCFNEHEKEHEIKTCGRSSFIRINLRLFIILLLIICL